MITRRRQPPQPPVDLTGRDARHGTAYVHGKLKCRCLECQEYRREQDRLRPPRGKNRPPVDREELGWYVCATRWGQTYAEHEYSRIGICIRCKAHRATEEYWEARWKESEMPKDPRDTVGENPTGRPRRSSAGKRRQESKKDPKKDAES